MSFRRDERGQTVVLVALMFTILLAGAALAVDVGRFYAERRFIQDAVDAAAVACAIKYAQSGQDALAAWSAADDVLKNHNLKRNPLGLDVEYKERGEERYDDNVAAPQNLNNGILPVTSNGVGCRVAITVAVPTYVIKVVNPGLTNIDVVTRAYAKSKGGFLPSVVKRYLNPGDADDIPGNDGPNEFVDTTAREGFDSACHSGSNYAPGCLPSTLANPGREIVLFGASQKASNDASFRGYIALDVRNFTDTDGAGNLVHDAYNGVAPNATVNTLKDFEATWIDQGYPGPDVCVVQSANFDKCAQVAVINGASSGIFVDHYNQFFKIGDIAMFQLYDGTVKTVPDFTVTPPGLTVPASGAVPAKVVAFTYSSQFQSSGSTVCTDIVPDNGSYTRGSGDLTGTNPFMTGAITTTSSGSCTGTGTGNLSANPTPSGLASYNQSWSGMIASGAQQGMYVAFLRGKASAPYAARIHFYQVKVVVAGQSTEYVISSSESLKSISFAGAPATVNYNIVVGTGLGPTKWQTSGVAPDGPITVSWETCPRDIDNPDTALGCYIGADGILSTTVTAGNTVVVTVKTSGIATQKSYAGWIRTVGYDNGGHPVVKLWPVQLDVDQQSGGTTVYVDVIGYAAYKITNVDPNDVFGRSVSGAYLDPNDSALAVGRKFGLVPWETP